MSKMSQLHAELTEQAYDLGFNSLDDALDMGYAVDYTERRLVKHECCDLAKELEQAHVAYIVEREQHLATLTKMAELLRASDLPNIASEIEDAVNFFKKGEC